MRRLKRLEPVIRSIVTERLDAMAAAGPEVDLVPEFAFAVPFEVICSLLGVPHADRAAFHRLGAARFDVSSGGVGAFGAAEETREFLINLVRELRSNPPEPSEDEGLLPALVREHAELDEVVLGGLADGVFLGGYETSASMLALGALVLMNQPHLADPLRAGEPADDLVEELLRYLTVVQVAFPRFAVRDLEVAGVPIKAGDVVMCSLSAADRDSVLGPGMDQIDAGRGTTKSHLAFGYGFHRCVGAELARMELRIAYPALVRRFPGMKLAADPAKLAMRRASIVFGLEGLPVLLE
jgi:cytochrome P450